MIRYRNGTRATPKQRKPGHITPRAQRKSLRSPAPVEGDSYWQVHKLTAVTKVLVYHTQNL